MLSTVLLVLLGLLAVSTSVLSSPEVLTRNLRDEALANVTVTAEDSLRLPDNNSPTNATVDAIMSRKVVIKIGKNRDMCLDVRGGGTARGTAVQAYPCNGTPAQEWIEDSQMVIFNPNELTYRNPQSGKCLDRQGGEYENATPLQIWDCNGSKAQVFHQDYTNAAGSHLYWVTAWIKRRCLHVAQDAAWNRQIVMWRCEDYNDSMVFEPETKST